MRLLKTACMFVVFLMATLMASGAFAQSDKLAEAKRLFRAGARAYDAGQFAAAAQAFEQAYELSPRPPLRFSAAQALRRQYTSERKPALLRKAQRYYREYTSAVKKGRRVKDAVEALGEIELLLAKHEPVKRPPDDGEGGSDGGGGTDGEEPPVAVVDPPAKTTGTLQIDSEITGATATVAGRPGTLDDLPQWLELPPGSYTVTIVAAGHDDGVRTVRVEAGRLSVADPLLREKLGHVKINADAGAEVLVDGKPAGQAPLSLDLAGGEHRIVIGQLGHSVFSQDITVGRGDSQTIDADLGMTTQRVLAYIVLGGAAATLSVGVLLASGAANRQRTARETLALTKGTDARALTVAERDAYNSELKTRDDLARFSAGAFILGALAAGVGFLMLTVDKPNLYAAAVVADKAKDGADKDEDEDEAKEDEKKGSTVELDASVVPLLDGTQTGAVFMLQGTF